MSAYNFDRLTEEQAETLLQLWFNNQHADAKKLLQTSGVVTCASCLDNTSYQAWMLWWLQTIN